MGAAWWWALTHTVGGPGASQLPKQAALVRGPQPPEVELGRLRRVARVPLGAAVRDPFAPRAEPHLRAQGRTDVAGEPAAARQLSPAASVDAWPRLELIGIGTRRVNDTTTRVAVLAADLGVLHAVAGDDVLDVYRVMRVEADAVEVRLIPEDSAFMLRLR